MMDQYDIENFDLTIVPDLLFALSAQSVEGVYISDTKTKVWLNLLLIM